MQNIKVFDFKTKKDEHAFGEMNRDRRRVFSLKGSFERCKELAPKGLNSV